MFDKNLIQSTSSWPFVEVRKLLKDRKEKIKKKDKIVFETGYGPSGLPHIGTFGEVARTSMMINALNYIEKIDTDLITFSDDMDGLRKVPDNIPNSKILEKNLGKPLTSIPDPFGKYKSFGEHNNEMLKMFLKKFEFNFNFKSSTENYKKGIFNDALLRVLEKYEDIMNIILPTLGDIRKKTYSPFLPICPDTGKVLEIPISEIDKKNGKVIFNNHGKKLPIDIINGNCKLQWKVDWAMRWYVLGIDYEMNGKDLIESYILSNKITKIIGGRTPVNYTYELFLDEKGEKISKSIGNGISVDDWLRFSNKKSLELYMFQNPNRAKRLFFDVIPKTTDELLKLKNDYDNLSKEQKFNSPIWFIDEKNKDKIPEKISFNMILNLASVCNAESSEILWGFIENYYPKIVKEDNKLLNELLGYGVVFYKEFILPNKKYRNPSDKEKIGFKKLIEVLKTSSTDEEPEEIQTKIYEIGMSLKFENLKDWFSAFYQVILGQDQGPRLGSFIKFYGLKKTILLLEEKLLDEK